MPPVPDPARTALFLDFDGTLVPIAPQPDAVVVDRALADLLDRLAAAMPGRVAIVSGRSVAQLDALLGVQAVALAVAGSHGAERRTAADGHVVPVRSPALESAAAELAAYADLNDLFFEAKTFGAALHFRQRPECENDAIAMATLVAATYGLTLQRGKMMAEVRLPGDKGAAVETLMAAESMHGLQPWFLGDDVTDEDGFAAAERLGGAGVLVGPPRATLARHRLPDVAAVHAWLAALADRAR